MLILAHRFGGETRDPGDSTIAAALEELYHDAQPGVTAQGRDEHGSASLRYLCADGPMYVIEVNRHGTVRFEQWQDVDYEAELAAPGVMRNVPHGGALGLWRLLAKGSVARLRGLAWEPA